MGDNEIIFFALKIPYLISISIQITVKARYHRLVCKNGVQRWFEVGVTSSLKVKLETKSIHSAIILFHTTLSRAVKCNTKSGCVIRNELVRTVLIWTEILV
jgi:hypothetical protein